MPGFPQMGTPAGLVLANGIFLTTSAVMSDTAFASWGWRIPFLLSFVLVAIGLVIRLRVTESPSFAGIMEKGEVSTFPLRESLKVGFPRLSLTLLACFANSAVAYAFMVFTLSYGTQHLGYDKQFLVLSVTAAAVLWFAFHPGLDQGRRQVRPATHVHRRIRRNPVVVHRVLPAAEHREQSGRRDRVPRHGSDRAGHALRAGQHHRRHVPGQGSLLGFVADPAEWCDSGRWTGADDRHRAAGRHRIVGRRHVVPRDRSARSAWSAPSHCSGWCPIRRAACSTRRRASPKTSDPVDGHRSRSPLR